jgi:acetyltransferase-like isoleucine patch superfamily enzyme
LRTDDHQTHFLRQIRKSTQDKAGKECPELIKILKRFYWTLRLKEDRLLLIYAFVREIPGQLGILIRRRVVAPHLAQVGENLMILEGARFRNPQKISCGDNVGIGNDVLLQAGGGITLGSDTLLGPGVKIWTQNHRYGDPDTPIREQGDDFGPVTIGDDCWIGSNAFIMPGVHLPRGCVVAAGSVVGAKPYKEFSVLMGNPARVVGFRGAKKNAKSNKSNMP